MRQWPLSGDDCREVRFAPRRSLWTGIAAGMLTTGLATTVAAQSPRTVLVAPTYQSWTFDQPVPLDTLRVQDASQISAPFLVSLPFASRFAVSVSGAAFSSRIRTAGTTADGETRSLSGVTDLRFRLTGPLIGDAVQFTLGVNAPTGNRGLSLAENDVLRVVAAPALGAQVAVPGVGFGGTVGIVAARMAGNWALAFGLSAEHRGSYSPLDAVIAGRGARTELTPGAAVHLSLGADRALGAHRLTIALSGDLYGSDEVRSITGGTQQVDNYKLGPTGTATVALQIGGTGFRELHVHVSDRYRSAFTDASGASISGSSGNYLDAGITGVLGSAGGVGVLLGLDARQHSGLPVDEGFIGAGLTAGGVTVGLSVPTGGVEWRPTFRYSQGTLKTERLTTAMSSITVGLSLGAR
jgi:hypothetical protein